MKSKYGELKARIEVSQFLAMFLPEGVRRSNEWVCRNPTRDDKYPGSFKINMNTGVWCDFATRDRGGDVIDLYAYIKDLSLEDAFSELSALYGSSSLNISSPYPTKSKLICPIPSDIGSPPRDNATAYWPYTDINGDIMFYVARYDFYGKKCFVPFTWREIEPGKCEWVKKAPEFPTKPIYKLHELADKTKIKVLIVEGEGCANMASWLLPDFACLSWLGGAASAEKVDFSILADRDVYLWPDNDEPGEKAMLDIQKKLPNAKLVKREWLSGKPEKWDLSDGVREGMAKEDVLEILARCNSALKFDSSTYPVLSEKGNPMNCSQNLEHLCNFHNIKPRYDTIKKEMVMNLEHKNFSMANKSKLEYAEICELASLYRMPRSDLMEWLVKIADKNRFNPVLDYINSKPWDGISRIKEFLNTIQCSDIALRDMYIYKWMIGAIAVASSAKGLAHPGVLTFVGRQGCGKSMWFRKLVPEEYELTMGEFILNPDDKDSVISATKNWIVELAEADATIGRSESNAQKSFITRHIDTYRAPYDRVNTNAPRNTCFIGTANDSKFLKDETGNRRWWVLEVESMNWEHTLDMQQVWAEFKKLLDGGESFNFAQDELECLITKNEEFRTQSAIEEAIGLKFQWEKPQNNKRMSALQVLAVCGIDTSNAKGAIVKEAHRVLKKLTGKKPKTIRGLMYYDVPFENFPNKNF